MKRSEFKLTMVHALRMLCAHHIDVDFADDKAAMLGTKLLHLFLFLRDDLCKNVL